MPRQARLSLYKHGGGWLVHKPAPALINKDKDFYTVRI
jgi:hypothetical protein